MPMGRPAFDPQPHGTPSGGRERKCLLGCGDGPPDIFFRVRGAEECGLKLRGGQVHPVVQHGAEEAPEGLRI